VASESGIWPELPSESKVAANGDDLETALLAAEALQRDADRMSRAAFIVVVIAAGATIIAFAIAVDQAVGSHWWAVLASSVAIALNAFIAAQVVARLLRMRALKNSLADRIVVMLREVSTDIYDREKWSHLRRRALTVRLSAFPITGREREYEV
jgi:hypothetical protein